LVRKSASVGFLVVTVLGSFSCPEFTPSERSKKKNMTYNYLRRLSMKRKAITTIIVALFLASMLTMAFTTRPVSAEPVKWGIVDAQDGNGDGWIKADGNDTIFVSWGDIEMCHYYSYELYADGNLTDSEYNHHQLSAITYPARNVPDFFGSYNEIRIWDGEKKTGYTTITFSLPQPTSKFPIWVGTVARTTTKFYDTPYYTNGVDEWITKDTLIYLKATYPVNATYFRVWYDGDWTDWMNYTEPFNMATLNLTGDGKYAIKWYSVDNLGNAETWEEVNVTSELGKVETYSAIAVDTFGLGTIHMVYTEEGSQNLTYEVSSDFGETWTGKTVLVSGLAEVSEPDIEIAPNGDIHVVFHGNETGQHYKIYHIWYNFSANDYSYDNATDPANWENRVLVNDTGRDNVCPHIAIDSLNIVHCVWIGDSDGVIFGGAQDIFYSRFNGSGWSPRITLYANATKTPGWPNPQIIADPYDSLHVCFLDSNEHNMKYLMYNSSSGEWGSYHGGSWNIGVADNVGNSSASYGTIAGMAVEGDYLHVAWQDVRGGIGQVYENTRNLTETDPFGAEWAITSGDSIDNNGTLVGETLMESGEFDNLHLFYRDSIGRDIWYMEYSSAWSTPVKAADSGPDHVHLLSEMAVDDFDSPLLTYTKTSNDYTEFDVYFRKPYHIQTLLVDNTPPITTKTVGYPKYGLNDEWVTTDTNITLDGKDNCQCEKYAILIQGCGEIEDDEGAAFKNDIKEAHDLLRTKKWDKKNIWVFSPEGTKDYKKEKDKWPDSTSDIKNPYKSTLDNIRNAFRAIGEKKSCCILYFYFSGHGGKITKPESQEPENSVDSDEEALKLCDEAVLDDDDLSDYLVFVKNCKNIIVVIQACYSGGFIPDIVSKFREKGIIICTSTSEDKGTVSIPKRYGIYNHLFTEALKKKSVEKAHDDAKKKLEERGWSDDPQIWDKDRENKFLKCPGTGRSTLKFRIWYDGEWGPEQVSEPNQPVTLKFTEEGEHKIEYWAVDALGNEEEHHIQTHYVIAPYSPIANFTEYPETPYVHQPVYFDASTSKPGFNGTHTCPITEYRWDFGDGNKTTTTTPIIHHIYERAGIYYVTLTVYAPGATPETDSKTHRITVISIPVGGYSLPIQLPTTAIPVTVHIALLTILMAIFLTIKQKTKRKH